MKCSKNIDISNKISVKDYGKPKIFLVVFTCFCIVKSLMTLVKSIKRIILEENFKKMNFENFNINSENEVAVKVAKNYTNKNIVEMQKEGLIITGKSGLGKTHLAASIANKLIENDKIVLMDD